MTGDNIICFARDWDEPPTSNNHVMRELARHNNVLWLNSVATRVPDLRSGHDLKKIFRKLAGFLRGPRKVGERMWVYTPIVVPLPHSRVARALNRLILRASIALLRRKLGFRQFQLWSFLPNVADYFGAKDATVSVYYCVDEWAGFSNIDAERMTRAEAELCRRVDVVFATSRSLVEKKRLLNDETYLAEHGVDHALFSRALDDDLAIPADVASLPQPIVGYIGTLQDWFDQDLITFLARRHPEWTFVLLGKPTVDLTQISALPNAHFLGRRSYDELPAYCKTFSVGLIPYVLNAHMPYQNPLKRFEYLAAGVPVVSTAIPEVVEHGNLCTVARSYEEFERAVAAAIRSNSADERRARSAAMQSETWQARVQKICEQVARIKSRKCVQAAR
jgi:glycosyltransferase involved in cell wall biosynthesis